MLDSLRDMQALGSLWFLSSIYLASSDWEETHGLCRQGHRVSPEYLKVSFDTYHYTHMVPSPSFRPCCIDRAMLSISCEHVQSLWLDFLPFKLSQKEQFSLCKCCPADGHRQNKERLPKQSVCCRLWGVSKRVMNSHFLWERTRQTLTLKVLKSVKYEHRYSISS